MLRLRRALAVAVLHVTWAVPLVGQARDFMVPTNREIVGTYDRNGNAKLERDELIAYARATRRESAENFADDALGVLCDSPTCTSIDIRLFVDYLVRLNTQRQGQQRAKTPFGWPGLALTRKVGDPLNPRSENLQGPMVVSATWDFGNDSSWVDINGGIQLFQVLTGNERNTYRGRATVDLDVNSGRADDQNKVRVALPVAATWLWSTWIESIVVAVTPAVESDTKRRRDVREIALSMSPAVPKFAVGFVKPARGRGSDGKLPPISVALYPSAALEFGWINATGGNAKLDALVNAFGTDYRRIAVRAALVVYPAIASEGLRFRIEHTYRRDLTADANRHIWEVLATQDLLGAGTFQLTGLFRRGVAPPTFDKVDRLLIGIGLRF